MRKESGMKIDLTGKVGLVTGASGELGRVIARTLGECGADVAVHYGRNADKAESAAARVREFGVRAMTVQADITAGESVMAMRDAVVGELGEVDIVCANAVIQYDWKSILEQDVADFEGQFRSCSLQLVLLAKAFAPTMIARGWGRFVVTNTECALQCLPGQGAYASAKRGLDGVVRVLAREIGPHGITVNQVAPGWMISDKYRESGGQRQPEYEKNVPLRHRGEDVDIANAAAFFASDLARFITAAYLPVCGGNVIPGL